jgi:hypothetical protein
MSLHAFFACLPTAAPSIGQGTLAYIPYNEPGFYRYRMDGNWIDRGDLVYSGRAGDFYEFDFQNGVRLTHKNGFDGIGVNIYLDGVQQNTTPLYLTTGQVYFEAHPNTAAVKTLRVEIADRTYQDYYLQTGVDIWRP